MAIITISHQLGSGGGDIARIVSERLDYRYVGGEMLAEAAQRHGLVAERLMELGEAKPSFLDRLATETQLYIAVMQNAVYDAVRDDDVVLLGRGGQWLLRGIGHVFRVRVIAPFDLRVRRLRERLTTVTGRPLSGHGASDAVADLVRRDDTDKIGRMHYLYDRDLDDPQLYDLIVNTEADDPHGPAEVIVAAAGQPCLGTAADGQQAIVDRALAARVRVALMADERTRDYRHPGVEAKAGVVDVTTMAPSAVVEAVTRAVPDVVDVRITEIPLLPLSQVA